MGRTRSAPCAASAGSLSLPESVSSALESGREALLLEVARLNGGRAPDACSLGEARQRLAALATSADRVGVSFTGAALHHAYYSSKFHLRGGLLFAALEAALDFHACVQDTLLPNATQTSLRVASIGGGPGTDVAGLALLEQRRLRYGAAQRALARRSEDTCEEHSPAVACTLYDLERSWRRYLPALSGLMPQVSLSFHPCDVRCALSNAEAAECVNKHLAACVSSTRLFIFSFVAHETAVAAAATCHVFYRQLSCAAPDGALFLFLDVRGHAADVLNEIHAAMASSLLDADGSHSITRLSLPTTLPADSLLLHKRDGVIKAPQAV